MKWFFLFLAILNGAMVWVNWDNDRRLFLAVSAFACGFSLSASLYGYMLDRAMNGWQDSIEFSKSLVADNCKRLGLEVPKELK